MQAVGTENAPNYELSDIIDHEILSNVGQQRNNVLTNKVSTVLSASYADSDIRNALQDLDNTKLQNTPGLRRRLRLDVQKDVIECNAEIIDQFGIVAEVRT